MELNRMQLREKVLECLYSCLMKEKVNNDYDPKEELINVFDVSSFSDIDLFAQEIFVKALINKEEITSKVQNHLNKWKFERLNLIAQAIFLLAISEASYAKASDKKVAIDCAIELAKKYLDASDYKYINAILDKVI